MRRKYIQGNDKLMGDELANNVGVKHEVLKLSG